MSETDPEFSQKIDVLIRLQAISLVEGKPQREQIILLSLAGLKPREIADLIRTTANTVNVTLSKARKSGELRIPDEPGNHKP